MAAQPLDGRGVVVREAGAYKIEELTFLPPGPKELRMKVHACGVCQSDVSVMKGKIEYELPMLIGHEGAGIVEAVGPGCSLAVGDWVVLTLVTPCGQCPRCKSGKPGLCEDRVSTHPKEKVLDKTGKPVNTMMGLGCMAEYAVLGETSCVKVNQDVPLQKCVLVSCGVITGAGAAMNCAQVPPGASCCVFGCGGVGLNAIQGCRICGADKIVAVDTNPAKLEFAKSFGATHTINAQEVKDVVEEVKELTAGGVEYGFEIIGHAETCKQAYDVCRPGGLTVLVGIPGPNETLAINPFHMLSFERTVRGCFMGSGVPSVQVPLLIQLYKKGTLKLDELISGYYTIQDTHKAFEDLASGRNLRGIIVMHDLQGFAEHAQAASPSRKRKVPEPAV